MNLHINKQTNDDGISKLGLVILFDFVCGFAAIIRHTEDRCLKRIKVTHIHWINGLHNIMFFFTSLLLFCEKSPLELFACLTRQINLQYIQLNAEARKINEAKKNYSQAEGMAKKKCGRFVRLESR